MIRLICCSLLLLLLTGCGSKRKVVIPKEVVRDSIVYRERVVKVTDTVSIEIPLIVEKNVTADTCSYLKNIFAESWASVDSSGLLHHSLSTIPQSVNKESESTVVYRDSIAWREREVPVPYPVEKKLSLWEKICIHVMPWVTFVLVIVVFWNVFRSRRK